MKFYFDQVNKAWMTSDDTLIPPLSKSSCKSCAGLQADVVELKAKGQRMDPAPGRLTDVRAVPGAPPGRVFVAMRLHQIGARVLDAQGQVVDRDKQFVRSFISAVTWENGRWLMLGVASA